MITLQPELRTKFWQLVLSRMNDFETVNERAIILQTAISEVGPVPDELGEQVRQLLKPKQNDQQSPT